MHGGISPSTVFAFPPQSNNEISIFQAMEMVTHILEKSLSADILSNFAVDGISVDSGDIQRLTCNFLF